MIPCRTIRTFPTRTSVRRHSFEAILDKVDIWQGKFADYELAWMRWWDARGNLLLTGEQKSVRLAEKLKSLGVDPDQA